MFHLPCRETLDTLPAIVGSTESSRSSSIDKRSNCEDTMRIRPMAANGRYFPFLSRRFFDAVIDGLVPSSFHLNKWFARCKCDWSFLPILIHFSLLTWWNVFFFSGILHSFKTWNAISHQNSFVILGGCFE